VSKFKRLSELELQVCWHGINKPINEMLLVAWLLIQRNPIVDIPKSDLSSSALVIFSNYRRAVFSVRLGAPPEQI